MTGGVLLTPSSALRRYQLEQKREREVGKANGCMLVISTHTSGLEG